MMITMSPVQFSSPNMNDICMKETFHFGFVYECIYIYLFLLLHYSTIFTNVQMLKLENSEMYTYDKTNYV